MKTPKTFICFILLALSSSLFIPCSAQYSVLLNFNYMSNPEGAEPNGSLTLVGNKLCGMTDWGGLHDNGCIFSITTNGSSYIDLFDFSGATGEGPIGSLTLSRNKFYGMTNSGGPHGFGNIFSMDTNGSSYKDLFDFNITDGLNPFGSLTIYKNKLYGMTYYGGINDSGCIFSIDTNGNEYKDLWDFGGRPNGSFPYGSLTLSGNKLFGMTSAGGVNDSGCIFSIDTNGNAYKDLFDFNGLNGDSPGFDSLILFKNMLYGMTPNGGKYGYGLVFSIDTGGNNFKDIFDFNGTNGGNPYGALTLSGKVLYGMTYYGGTNDSGEIFAIDTDGSRFKVMYDFDNMSGYYSSGSLTISGNTLYGMTREGGVNKYYGVIFKIDTSAVAGVNNIIAKKAIINVYPNPSNGVFELAISHAELVSASHLIIEVYNVIGEQVYYATLNQVQGDNLINICNQPAGMYFYRAITNTGSLVGEGKVVIEK